MFVIDNLGWNDTSYIQGSDIPMPTIDELASQGICLQQYHVQRLCLPSRAAVMAGRYLCNMGLAHSVISNGFPIGLPLNQTTVTTANELKRGGYAMHCIGKWDLGMHKWAYTPTYREFDRFYGYYDAVEDYYAHYTEVAPIINSSLGVQDTTPMFFKGLDFRNNTVPLTDENIATTVLTCLQRSLKTFSQIILLTRGHFLFTLHTNQFMHQ